MPDEVVVVGDAGGTPAVHCALVDGAPAILFVLGSQAKGAVTFDIVGGQIATVRGIAAPARLVEVWRQDEPDMPLMTRCPSRSGGGACVSQVL